MKGEIDEILPFYMIRSCKDVRNEFLNKLSLLCLFLSIRNQRIKN